MKIAYVKEFKFSRIFLREQLGINMRILIKILLVTQIYIHPTKKTH